MKSINGRIFVQKRSMLIPTKQNVTQTVSHGDMASGAGRKAQGGITAICMFFLAPDALSLEPLFFQQCFGYKIGN